MAIWKRSVTGAPAQDQQSYGHAQEKAAGEVCKVAVGPES